MLFVPLNNAAYLYLPKNQVNNATGLFNMLRNEGGSLGIAIVTVMTDRRTQFHQSRLAEHVTPLNPAVNRWTDYFAQTRMVRGGVTRVVAEQQSTEHGHAVANGPRTGPGDGLSRRLLDLRHHRPSCPAAGSAHETIGPPG